MQTEKEDMSNITPREKRCQRNFEKERKTFRNQLKMHQWCFCQDQ